MPGPIKAKMNKCCGWCEGTRKASHFMTADNVRHSFCSEDCLKEHRAAFPRTQCANCDRQVSGAPISYSETASLGTHETRDFCCTECLQKFRLRTVQKQQQNNRSQPQTQNSESVKRELEVDSATKTQTTKVVKLETEVATNGSSDKSRKAPVRRILPATSNTPTEPHKSTINSTTRTTNDKTATPDSSSSVVVIDDIDEEGPADSQCSVAPSQTDKPKSSKRASSITSRHHYETFGTFNWVDYLEEVGGVPAPAECFRQNRDPPDNKFELQMKVEAQDPRNSSSICIGTIVGLLGPRVQVRLDGSDNSNDFWELVDSTNIKPIGSCEKNGGMLQPPLGFRKNPSHFHIFVANTLQGATIAPDNCFKPSPQRPKENLFDVGMKLEAVDRKNPRLICPATVGEVNENEIFVTFDGWKGAFDYWALHDSRELFPVGWCQRGGHPLQPPGDKVCDLRKKGPHPKYILPSPLSAAIQSAEKKLAATNGSAATNSTSTATNRGTTEKTTPPAAAQPIKKIVTTAVSPDGNGISTPPPKKLARKLVPTCQLPGYNANVTSSTKPQTMLQPMKASATPPPSAINTNSKTIQTAKNNASQTRKANINLTPNTAESAATSRPAPVLTTPPSNNPLDWNINEVIKYLIGVDKSLDIHSDIFRKHEIDGKAFLLLSSDMMMKYMGLKLGPALKIGNIIERLKTEKKSLLNSL